MITARVCPAPTRRVPGRPFRARRGRRGGVGRNLSTVTSSISSPSVPPNYRDPGGRARYPCSIGPGAGHGPHPSQPQPHLTPNTDHTGLLVRAAARNPAVCHGPTDPALGRPAKQHDPPCERRAGQESQDRCRGRDSASRNPAGATRGEGTRAAGGAAQGRDRGSPASAVAAGGAWGGGVVLRQLLHPQPLVRVVRRRIAPPPCQVAGGAAHRPVVDSDSEQQLRFVLTYLPHVGLGAGNSPPRSKNGLRKLRWRSTLTVGQPEQRIRRGGARV